MTESQKQKLEKAENDLIAIYWELIDNKEIREAKRLDTIIGKIQALKNLK